MDCNSEEKKIWRLRAVAAESGKSLVTVFFAKNILPPNLSEKLGAHYGSQNRCGARGSG